MGSVNIPFLPAGIWAFAMALIICVLLLAFFFYLYFRKRATALIKDGGDVAHLASQKQLLQADVDQLRQWMIDQKVELERLQIEREEQLKVQAELTRLDKECDDRQQENQALRKEVGELENQRHHISQNLERMQREIGDLDAKRAEAQSLESHLAELRSRLEDAQQSIRNLAELEVKLNILSTEKAAMEMKLSDLKSESELANAEGNRLKEEVGRARAEADQISQELVNVRRERAELGVTVDTLRQEQYELKRSTEYLEQKIEELKISSRNAQEEAEKQSLFAKQALTEAERSGRELVTLQKERQLVAMEVSELNARKAVFEQELSRLERKLVSRPGDGEDPFAPYADLLEKQPLCLKKEEFTGKRDEIDEFKLLQQVKITLRNEGLVFSSRIIDAFHTSLKCHDINPITVLAGVSGTGKTLLPVRYADIMGMHRLVMAVQPRWDSPQDMFGFYDYLAKEYKATELSRALVRMDPFNYPKDIFPMLDSGWAKDRLLLVLIDEMNLARTEYYFSEFLSRLELRRMVSNPALSKKRSDAEIDLDTGPGKLRFRLWIEHNIFFVGTMNEDETTQTLSDKVIDRANVLRFGKPDEKARYFKHSNGNYSPSEKYLSFEQWRNWHRELNEKYEWAEQVSNWTRKLNEALNRVGRPFGFRIFQAIGHYVANYPLVEDGERYKLAFADQIEQKIIPKIRGIDLSTDTGNECLSEIEAIIAELPDRDLIEAFLSARNESRMVGMFQWRGVTRREEEEAPRHVN